MSDNTWVTQSRVRRATRYACAMPMNDRTTYVAVCERSGEWWAVSVDGVRGAYTQTKRLDEVEATTRDMLAMFLEVPEDSFDIKVQVR